jgi:hypothetical protein
MGATRKGRRRIVIDGVEYFWSSRGDDYGIGIAVCTSDAFERGQRGQWLRFQIGYESRVAADGHGWQLHQRSAVTPVVIRRAIEIAHRRDPPFTGRPGQPDVVLDRDEAHEALDLTIAQTIAIDLRAATAELDRILAPRAVTQLMGCWFAIGRNLESGEPSEREPVDDWICVRSDQLIAARVTLQQDGDAIPETLVRAMDRSAYSRCCEQRSAIEFLIAMCRDRDVGLDLDTRRTDELLRAVAVDRPTVRSGIPASHWWWHHPRIPPGS